MATYDRSSEIAALSAWVVSRVRKLNMSMVGLIALITVIFQTWVLYGQINGATSAVKKWVEGNEARLEQAIFLRNSLPIESLIGEMVASSDKQIDSVLIKDKDGNVLYSKGDFAPSSPVQGLRQDFFNLRVTFHDELRFAELSVGSIMVSASYNIKALLSYSLILLLALISSVFFVSYGGKALIKELNGRLDSVIKSLAEADRENADALGRAQLAAKVSHDIRSPLSALKIISQTLSSESEEKRLLVQASVKRLEEIASHLLDKSQVLFKTQNVLGSSRSRAASVSLSSVLQSLVNEVKLSQANNRLLTFHTDINQAFDGFVDGNEVELKRGISNLLNNAIEAGGDSPVEVRLSAVSNERSCLIVIRDNGRGMPKDILEKLGKEFVTYGKVEGKGNGLGVYFAVKAIREQEGKVEFRSVEGEGTTVTIELPNSRKPNWFFSNLALKPDQRLVIVDDESFIHSVWDMKMKSLAREAPLHCYSAADFSKWWSGLDAKEQSQYFCMIDYDFVGEKKTGANLIREFELAGKSAVITGRGGDHAIISEAESLRVPVLDKMLVPLLPVSFPE